MGWEKTKSNLSTPGPPAYRPACGPCNLSQKLVENNHIQL